MVPKFILLKGLIIHGGILVSELIVKQTIDINKNNPFENDQLI